MTTRSRTLPIALLLLALLGTGCSSGDTPGDTTTSSTEPTAAATPSSPAPSTTAEAETTAEATAETTAEVAGWFPTAEGTTWEYTTDSDATGTLTHTQSIASSTPVDDGGTRLTLRQDFEDGTDIELDYVVNSDGTIDVPYQSITPEGQGVTIEAGGAVVWPGPEQHAAGTTLDGQLDMEMSAGGQDMQATVTYSSTPRGRETVTVTAGEYDAAVLEVAMEVEVQGSSQQVTMTIWLVEGVGHVRQEVSGSFGSTTTELIEFAPA